MAEIRSNRSVYPFKFCPAEDVPLAGLWYPILSHSITITTILFGTYGAFLIHNHLPNTLGVYKKYVIIYQIMSIISTVSLSSGLAPVYYFPLIAGYTFGVYDYINISFPDQINLNVAVHYLFYSSCFVLFFHRYWLVRSISPDFNCWTYKCSVIFLATFMPITFMAITTSTTLRNPRVDIWVAGCSSYKTLLQKPKAFLCGSFSAEMQVRILIVLFGSYSLIFSSVLLTLKQLIIRSLKRFNNLHSEKTSEMHKRFLKTLLLQILFPISCLATPCFATCVIVVFEFNVSLDVSNIIIAISDLHGLVNTSGIIWLNKNIYNQVIRDICTILRIKKADEWTSTSLTNPTVLKNSEKINV